MAKLPRKNMKLFGSTATVSGQMGVFGSLAAGSAAYSSDPDVIQSLSNYLTGWFGAIVGSNSPAIQDMNALCFLFAYQLAYCMQTGVPEWNAATTYYVGSVVNNGGRKLYQSITNGNINNALTDVTNWQLANGPEVSSYNPSGTPTYTLTQADNGKSLLIESDNGAMSITLPAATADNWSFTIISAGASSTNAITLVRTGSERIAGQLANYLMRDDFGSWTFVCFGGNWYAT